MAVGRRAGRAAIGWLTAAGASLALGGCGFQLEGAETLPQIMAATYLQSDSPNSEFFSSLRAALRGRGLELASSPNQAGALLIISEDTTGQRVLSVSARNTPREFEVYYAVTVSLQAGAERLMDAESLVATRSYTYDETEVLGKSNEERVLRRALADDLARQVLRRIASLSGIQAPAG